MPTRVFGVVLLAIGLLLIVEILAVLVATSGHFVYPLEAAYTHLALADQIYHGHYGLAAGEAAAPSSSILYPLLLAALHPLGLGALLPLAINLLATLATGCFAVLIAGECQIPLQSVPTRHLFVLAAVMTLALDLPGLALTGLEHALHVAMTVAYLLGLLRFVRRGRGDWWWFACIVIQPTIRFEAAGMVVADALIFVAFRKYGYALAMVAVGVVLVGGYSLFLHSLGLPLLPSSVLARSDWSNAAVATHSGPLVILASIFGNLHANLNSFGAAQMLFGVALPLLWAGGAWADLTHRPIATSNQVKLVTLAFMSFVTFAQLTGGKLGWVPSRYDAYVLALNLCGVAVIFRETLASWCDRTSWPGVLALCLAMLLIFSGYATQFSLIPVLAKREYQGPVQLHRFVTAFYRAPVAVNQIGFINYRNPYPVLDLSGLGSETARLARMHAAAPAWMDAFLAAHDVGLAIIDTASDADTPSGWLRLGELHAGSTNDFILYARRPADAAAISAALDRFVPTLPTSLRLTRTESLQ